ncbi:prolactin-releasing peptide receptor [Nematostella vectensis]|uniref:prolactin-releasing peptide receptor n=1 Tax=Nematostella vectensis TaxID=45351 RepID=UPI00207712C1|nr:prolactin-releasing peptide receptor [Nematostella vectensis]
MALSAIGNLLLVSVIVTKKRFHNVTNIYNLNLSASDLLKVLVYVPVYLVYASKMTWPLGGQVTIRQSIIHIIIIWCACTVLSGVSVLFIFLIPGPNGSDLCIFQAKEELALAILALMLLLSQFIPMVFFVISYCLVIKKLRQDSSVEPRDRSIATRNRARRNRRAVRILVVEVWAYVICVMPFLIMNITEVARNKVFLGPFTTQSLVMYCALVLHTTINPSVHFVLNLEFRQELRDMCLTGWRALRRMKKTVVPMPLSSSSQPRILPRLTARMDQGPRKNRDKQKQNGDVDELTADVFEEAMAEIQLFQGGKGSAWEKSESRLEAEQRERSSNALWE